MNKSNTTVGECVDYFTRRIKVIDESIAAWRQNPDDHELETDLVAACSPAAEAEVRGAGEELWAVVDDYHSKWLEALKALNSHHGVEEEPGRYWLDKPTSTQLGSRRGPN